MWTPRNFKTLDPLHYSPIDGNGGLFGTPFPVVHDQLLCLAHIEGEVVVSSANPGHAVVGQGEVENVSEDT
jgi:hypothetical protein